MWKRRFSRLFALLAILLVLVVVASIAAAMAGVTALAPLKTATVYPWAMLASEANTVNRCLTCHKADEMHTCQTCHDAHGGLEMPNIPFDAVVQLAGDFPQPGVMQLNQIFPYVERPNTAIALTQFLRDRGVEQFESVTLAAPDGAAVTLEPANLTDDAVLIPHKDGMRFRAENLHISTWLKGITRIIVVGTHKPLTIDGTATSVGRLLLGPTSSVTVEPSDVMLKSPEDGEIRQGRTFSRVEGVAVEPLLANSAFSRLLVRDGSGRQYELSREDARGALLTQMWGKTVLVLPERGRAKWVADVVELVSQ